MKEKTSRTRIEPCVIVHGGVWILDRVVSIRLRVLQFLNLEIYSRQAPEQFQRVARLAKSKE